MANKEDLTDKRIQKQIQQNIEVTEALKKMLAELDKKKINKRNVKWTQDLYILSIDIYNKSRC